MHSVIDAAWNLEAYASQIKNSGVETVIRYYNHRNSSSLPSKRLSQSEAGALTDAGLSLAVVFQQGGGHKGQIEQLDAKSGHTDAQRALELAAELDQPEGSAIYFAVDHDYWRSADLNRIKPYFEKVRNALDQKYRVGVYSSGSVGRTMREAGFVDLIWLAAAPGWSGTKEVLETDEWALCQKYPLRHWPGGGFPYDPNIVSAAWPDYGQFRLGAMAATGTQLLDKTIVKLTTLMEVTARRGLNLRAGPGETYKVLESFDRGVLVHALGYEGAWVKVDIGGDDHADGYMHGAYLKTISGGLPIDMPADSSAYDIARAELALDVREAPGTANNPRIVAYHSSTNAWSGSDDSVAWCSSFVNWCIEKSGRIGNNSQRALDWLDWGQDVTDSPQEGDIAVFKRSGGGHVAFFVNDLGSSLSVLGGNQGQRVSIMPYPKDGDGYKLLSIRRG